MLKIRVLYPLKRCVDYKYVIIFLKSKRDDGNVSGDGGDDVTIGYALEVQLTGFGDELDVGCERGNAKGMTLKFHDCVTG